MQDPKFESFPLNAKAAPVIKQYYLEQLACIPAAIRLPVVVMELITEFAEQQFYTDQLFDVRDKFQKWCVGRVVEVGKEDNVLIHYEGWSSKWDEWIWIPADSARFAQHGTHTQQRGPHFKEYDYRYAQSKQPQL
eukprot:TRINITY_DN4202_c0_g1_i1.p1 TRINITY_DN4202_c0_g1~~TRINITY_DN4202_c0_g1_i1.p1  ORF type:complete len:135 (-),score=31.90 TRINITY_DN4202_c0_g1_i1:264-668(-)